MKNYTKYFSLIISLLFSLTLLSGCSASKNTVNDLVWPAPPEKSRLKYLTSYSDRKSIEGGGSGILDVIIGEDSREALGKPYGVAADRSGKVYVTESEQGKVFIFDTKDKKLTFLGKSGSGSLSLPLGIAVGESGFVYVADGKLKVVMVYNEQGKMVRTIGNSRELLNPAGVALDETRKRLYVVDSQGHDIKVYSTTDGILLQKFGQRGGGDGEFNYPTNIVVGDDGRIYVTDTMNARVQVFDDNGKFAYKFGSLGDALGQFTRPKGITVDNDGNIFVVDAAFNNFQIFNNKGNLLMYVGSLGTAPGLFWLPAGICSDHQGKIYVVDQMNKRVQSFQLIKQEE